MEINKTVSVRNGYDYSRKISNSNLKNKDNLAKVGKVGSDIFTFSKKAEESSALDKAGDITMSESVQQNGFAEKLKEAKEQIIADLKKQRVIYNKEQVKEQIKSGEYVADAREIAAKMMISGFDFTV